MIQARINLQNPLIRTHNLNVGRVAWWLPVPGFIGGNTWYDLCGKYPGTLTSMANSNNGWASIQPPGALGNSLLFDGSAGYVSAPITNTLLGSTPTVLCWVNQFASGGSSVGAWVCGNTAYYGSFYLGWNAGHGNTFCQVFSGSGATVQSVAGTGLAGSWHRVGAVLGVSSKIYIDGKLDSSATLSSVGAFTALQIGGDTTDGYYAKCRLTDVSIYSRALSAAEFQQDYILSQQGYPGVLRQLPTRSIFGPQPVGATTFPWFQNTDLPNYQDVIGY